MTLILEALTATVCVIGLVAFAWWLIGRTLRPAPKRAARVLLSGRGDGADLEQTVRGFLWLRGLGLLYCPIIIVDIDLTPDGYELACYLASKRPGISVCSVKELGDYIL